MARVHLLTLWVVLWGLFVIGDCIAYSHARYPERKTAYWSVPGSGYAAYYNTPK